MRSSILGICLGLGVIITPITSAQSLPETIQQQIDSGREALMRGDYAEAIARLEEVKENLIARRNTEAIELETEILINNFLALGYQEIGDLEQAATAIASATKLLQEEDISTDLVAKVLNTQANLDLKEDDFQAAALNFRQARKLYRENKDTEGEIGATLNEAIALQKIGQYRTAQKILEKTELELVSMPKSLQGAVYKALGTTYATMGDFATAREKLEASIALTQDIDIEVTAKTKIDLAAVIGVAEPEKAMEVLQEALSSSKQEETQAIALLNSLNIQIETQNWETAREIANQSQDLVFKLPHNDFAKIDLIKKMAKLQVQTASDLTSSEKKPNSWISSLKLFFAQSSDKLIQDKHKRLLEEIAQSAQSRGVARIESYAIGTLAYLEEQEGNLDRAITLNKYALGLTQAIAAEDIAYQWQWQLGRIFKAQGNTENAIASYQKAVDNLGQIRDDLVSFNPESQYSFQESVEPVYRQLVQLLISQPTQDNLIQARNTIEALQMAELENYFRQACLQAKPEQIDQIDPTAATIYPIVTEENIAVLTSIPGQPIQLHIEPITADTVQNKTTELIGQFNVSASNKARKALSQEFYNWLIKPTVEQLEAANIQTLVFVLDSGLRNLPVSALYNGERYLVEDYAIALTPGLQLLPSSNLDPEKIQAVVGGLSQASQGFTALPGVETEIQEIAANVNSQLLLNQNFTSDRLRQTLKETTTAPILHLATHGQFSSKAEETFILTWDGRIDVNELEKLLKVREESPKLIPIELLVLSACQTAQGDDKAALGLAGVALKSGARTTLGTLWSVSDESTSLMIEKLYQEIATSKQIPQSLATGDINSYNKAQILRQAQLMLIKSEQFNHPYYWAPFILVGNWT